MASIDSIDFIKKSYCADYGTEKKDYNSVITGIIGSQWQLGLNPSL
jgi:hypothetical protein